MFIKFIYPSHSLVQNKANFVNSDTLLSQLNINYTKGLTWLSKSGRKIINPNSDFLRYI